MTKAYEAFHGLDATFIENQYVYRFCTGSLDKEAAQFTLNSSPTTLEEAQQKMKRFQENSLSVFGSSKRVRYVKEDGRNSRDSSRSPSRYRGRNNRSRSRSPKPRFNSSNSDAIDVNWLASKLSELFKNESVPKRGKSPERKTYCFICNSPDHIAPDCPDKRDGACYFCDSLQHKYKDCSQYEERMKKMNSENSNRSDTKTGVRS